MAWRITTWYGTIADDSVISKSERPSRGIDGKEDEKKCMQDAGKIRPNQPADI